MYKGTQKKRLSAEFSAKTLLVRRELKDAFRVLKENNSVNQKYYVDQNCPSEMKAKLRVTQTNKI